jgi:hypothetical protein
MQHNSDALIREEEQKLNKLKKEEILPRYISTSPLYCREEHVDENFE